MLLVKSISPSLSLDFLTRGVGVVKQAFWGGNRRHGQKKDIGCIAEAVRSGTKRL